MFYEIQDQSDKFAGYWNMFGIESGFGYNIFESDNLTVRSEVGLDYSQIFYTVNPEENTVSGMVFLHTSWRVANNLSTLMEAKYLSNLQDPELQDYRLESLLSFMITVITSVGLKTDFNLIYINKPPLVYPVNSEGEPVVGAKPILGKRLTYSFIQSIMVKF